MTVGDMVLAPRVDACPLNFKSKRRLAFNGLKAHLRLQWQIVHGLC
ncbi:MAG: hypothetical protein VKK59_06570 [Vampirovibrionales bacterium]|nr:hypothetical protein [Vampirovibrionales bacterium]